MRCRFASIGLKALVLLLAFVVGVGLTRFVHQKQKPKPLCDFVVGPVTISDDSSLPRVSLCELRAAPELYVDRVLVVPMKHRKSGMLRSDELCTQGDAGFDVEIVDGGLRESGTEAFWRGGEISLVGRFSKSQSAFGSTKYQFRVFRIFEARLFVSP